ncbi:hypothetical protein PPYR_09680 [Photinus pyralis]|uniref:Carboxylic ester hydrolase n=1 Tax=Photinus pyralis TaxID=7054 RepID=A0A5N4AMZ3_PHOPY|nr:venom carboxylesterase-6-like [Photinus pyralis]KAB0798687.1 hypothetical protein PPYR_09680 [Photinus pyralis]
MLRLLIPLICSAIFVLVAGDEYPVVTTPLGDIKGHLTKSYQGRTVVAFEGVPYAQPPLGKLRFKEPQPLDPWSDVLLANDTYVCLQFIPMGMSGTNIGTEDCLYLYIYIPEEKFSPDGNLDVIVHIHGGAFMLGAPKFLGGYQYITDRDVIFVSFNYRLGIFGFLSTEDEIIPGNYGLKDQVMALKWIQSNIKYFGGNPNSVTLTGLSAGAASVQYHYLSPLSKGLFHRGFSQSGTALNMWALTEEPSLKARKLGAFLNCSYESSQDLLDCLVTKGGPEIMQALKNFFEFINAVPFTPFGPVIEKGPDAFLPDHPYSLLKKGQINDYPWVCSNTKNEGIYPVGFFVLYRKLSELDEKWNDIAPFALDYFHTTSDENRSDITKEIRSQYLNNEELNLENIDKLIDLFSDRAFLVDAETAVRLHAKASKSPVYYYFFEYKVGLKSFFPKEVSGVAHSDDGRLFVHILGNPLVFEESDEKMKNLFMDFIYEFATTGIAKFDTEEWIPVNDDEMINYMQILSPDIVQMNKLRRLTSKTFWDDLPIIENGRLYNN